ncbi:MAG: NAD-dependent epimerase/dehydratase family protein [Chthoniobacteraceae bacterium]
MPGVLIAGCGFVGVATARLFHAVGWETTGIVRSPETVAELAAEPFRVVAADITNQSTLTAIEGNFEVVINCVSSGKGGAEAYRLAYLEGSQRLLEVFKPRLFIFTSSTSVYVQNDGSVVTEESPAQPDRETGQILREAEELALRHGGAVARLAGIYGPHRSVLLRKFLDGTAVIEGDGQRWINQIHRDDAASALFQIVSCGAKGVFNVADDTPFTQRDFYARMSAHLQKPLPPEGPVDLNRKRGVTSKRVSNARLRALGWTPKYPSYFDALAALLVA